MFVHAAIPVRSDAVRRFSTGPYDHTATDPTPQLALFCATTSPTLGPIRDNPDWLCFARQRALPCRVGLAPPTSPPSRLALFVHTAIPVRSDAVRRFFTCAYEHTANDPTPPVGFVSRTRFLRRQVGWQRQAKLGDGLVSHTAPACSISSGPVAWLCFARPTAHDRLGPQPQASWIGFVSSHHRPSHNPFQQR